MRFTIRDVLWLMVVVALAIAVWQQHSTAVLWRSRATGAAKALNDADRQNAWHDHGVVVLIPATGTIAPYQKAYLGK
jgi:hypothetical protein